MRIGKVSENVLVRSVLRKIKNRREEVICGAGVGTDCAVLSLGEAQETVLSTNPVSAPADMVGTYGIHRALNNIAASHAEPVGVLLSVLLPEDVEERELQKMMEQAEEICAAFHVEIIGGHTEVAAAEIREPILTVTGIGKRARNGLTDGQAVKPGQDVIISKWIGLEGTVRLAKEGREALLTRYPVGMIEEAAAFKRFLSIVPDAAIAVRSGVCGMHDVSQGGIFGALWEMAEKAGVGLEIDLKKLPLRQETVEICEFYDLNPYELLSGGALLMTAEDGTALVSALENEDIPAIIVGKTTAGKDRILYNGEEKRFLEPPKPDQIYQWKNRKRQGVNR